MRHCFFASYRKRQTHLHSLKHVDDAVPFQKILEHCDRSSKVNTRIIAKKREGEKDEHHRLLV